MMNGQCLAAEKTNKDLVNPFVHHLELTTTYEKIKAGILTVVVLPVRLLVIVCLLVLAWLLACVGLMGLSEADLQERPLTPWRRTVRGVSGVVLRCMMFFWGFHWVHVTGRKASRYCAPLIAVAPHSSFFDILAVLIIGDCSVVTRTENLDVPIVGKLINFTQPVYVWRDDPNSRQRTIKQIIDRATSSLDWSQVLIFPEGTCTNRSCLITFKPGAFYPGVPVQPVILRYPNKLDTVTWTWEGPGVLKLMWLTLVQPHSNCEIEFLPVYRPSEAERRDPKLYAENVRQLMARALGVPTLDYTYDDCQLVAKSNLLHIPRSCPALNIYKLRIRLGLVRNQREEKLVREQPELLCSKAEVGVTCEQLAALLGVPTDSTLQELFSLLQPDCSGRVDLGCYLTSVLMVDRTHSGAHMWETAFHLWGDRGRLSPQQLAALLRLTQQLPTERSIDVPTDQDGVISYSNFESFMKMRPEMEWGNNNNARPKVD
ncbi:lysophosphatidylcholine acyltransferase isoform X1 [Homalodisca vitripennis]|nr:lysophosphatidylcholine acyltransferase isoform X1 [Homalodisca vitripennis]